MRNLLMALPVLLLPIHANAQETDAEWLQHCWTGHWNGNRPSACDVQVKTIPATGSLTIRPDANGAVLIATHESNTIEVHTRAQGTGETNEAAAELLRKVTVDIGPTIAVRGPSTRGTGSWSVQLVVFVPKGTAIDAATVNGPIQVRDLVASMQLVTANGPISLLRVGGDVHAYAENGPLHVELAGKSWEGEGLNAESENGPVELEVPESYNAVLETGTTNGPVDIDFPLTLSGGRAWKHFTAKLGAGGAHVKAVTTNGPVSLRHS